MPYARSDRSRPPRPWITSANTGPPSTTSALMCSSPESVWSDSRASLTGVTIWARADQAPSHTLPSLTRRDEYQAVSNAAIAVAELQTVLRRE